MRWRALLPIGLAAWPAMAFAQTGDSTRTSDAPWRLGAHDVRLAAPFVLGTLALLPVDRALTIESQEPGAQEHRGLQRTASAFRWYGGTGVFAAAGATYLAGKMGHHPQLADLGLHGAESIVLAGAITDVLKGFIGRARPYAVHDSNAADLKFARGLQRGSAYSSFPSGHTTVAFAFASAVTAEAHHAWPRSTAVVAPLAYGTAALVGVSRVYNDDHWASDVVFAAGIGTLAGLEVVRFNHAHARRRLDRWLLGALPSPIVGRGERGLEWSLAP